MSESSPAFRDHLVRVLEWDEAHVTFDRAVEDIPAAARGARAAGFEHSPWELVEHIRIAQQDILDFCVNAGYAHAMRWPEDYWPPEPAPASPQAWTESLASYARDRKALQRLAHDVADLTAPVPTGTATQTYLRAILLTADHTAYHVGQIVAVRRALGLWPPSAAGNSKGDS
jgi:uncharacterized damage-inducible protein DinB